MKKIILASPSTSRCALHTLSGRFKNSRILRTFCLCRFCVIAFSLSASLALHAQLPPDNPSLRTVTGDNGENPTPIDSNRPDAHLANETPQAAKPVDPAVTSSESQQSEAPNRASPPTETKTEPEKVEKKKSAHRGSLVPAPLPISSPTVGLGMVPGLGYIFPFSKNDKISPPSVIGAAGLITNNGTRGFGLGADLYLKENTYEVTGLFVHGNVNYNLYGSGVNDGLKLPLVQSGHLLRLEGLRRIGWKVFVGPRFWTGQSFVTLARTDQQLPPLPPEVGFHTTMRALGLRMIRDTRPNQFFPTAGTKLEFTSDFFMQSLGSKFSFQSYRFTFNKYTSLRKNQVLAYDLFACGTSGAPPFYGNCIYATNNELRGYTAGKYLDRYLVTAQVEYRLTLGKGFGLAAFGGVGEVIPGSSQLLFKDNHFLPDIGGGPRYELSRKYHVNLRTDFARGRDSWTWSMGVGEAF